MHAFEKALTILESVEIGNYDIAEGKQKLETLIELNCELANGERRIGPWQNK